MNILSSSILYSMTIIIIHSMIWNKYITDNNNNNNNNNNNFYQGKFVNINIHIILLNL